MSQSVVLILLGVAFVLNIISFLMLAKKDDTKPDEDNLQGELILIHRSTNQIISEIDKLKAELQSIETKLETDDDIIGKFSKQGMSNIDMAKAMNRSVKEIDLIMKMRGNR